MKKFMKKSNKGFSMIELIIVIAIMAILIAVLAPVYTRYLERARRSNDTTLADHLKTAIETTLVDPTITNPANGVYILVSGVAEDPKAVTDATALLGAAPAAATVVTTSDFWDNIAGIMDSNYANGAAMAGATGLLSQCDSTGHSQISIIIFNDSAEVFITNTGAVIEVE